MKTFLVVSLAKPVAFTMQTMQSLHMVLQISSCVKNWILSFLSWHMQLPCKQQVKAKFSCKYVYNMVLDH